MDTTSRRYRTGCRQAIIPTLVALLLGAGIWALDMGTAEAVPAFARKYELSCNACHTRQPRLNNFGQRFLENGYQLPGTEDGGAKRKSLFGGPLGGATLDRNLGNYFAVRLRADVQKANFREKTEATDEIDIIFPNVINLFFAGTATKNISFFFEAEYATQGDEEGIVFERSFLVFDNLGGHQVANVKIGVFDPSAFYSFPTHRQQLNPIPPKAETNKFPAVINRIPLLPLAFSSKMFGLTTGPSTVGASTGTFNPMGAGAIPTYGNAGDKGFAILPFQPYLYNAPSQKGISVHGRPFGNSFLYQVGLAQNETAEDVSDTRWDRYIMVRYDKILDKYSAFQVSAFYYQAPEAARATLAPPTVAISGNIIFSQNVLDWTRYGIGARWQFKYFDIYGTIIRDEIDEPAFGNAIVDTSVWETKATGLSLEVDWLINSKWLLGIRYDYMEPGGLSLLPVPFRVAGDAKVNQDVSFIGIIGKYYPRPNIGLYARAHFNLESSEQFPANVSGGIENPGRNLKSMFTVGVDMAF